MSGHSLDLAQLIGITLFALSPHEATLWSSISGRVSKFAFEQIRCVSEALSNSFKTHSGGGREVAGDSTCKVRAVLPWAG